MVVGIGNVLMRDDATGPAVIDLLRRSWRFEPAVELLDAGTPGPDLAHRLLGASKVIFLDSVHADAAPGTVRTYGGTAIRCGNLPLRLTPHDPALRDAVLTLDFAGTTPAELFLVGVVPESIAAGTKLSASVRQALAEVETVVLGKLRAWGVRAHPTDAPPCQPWWEQAGEAAHS